MERNGFKIVLTLFFLGLSAWYLYPSVRSYTINNRLESLEGEALEAYERENFATIRDVREDALKLGLDLQGGMHVALEVRVDALIRALATDDEVDAQFEEVLAAAREDARLGNESVIDAFVDEFEARDAGVRLSRYFHRENEDVDRRAENEEVRQFLQQEASDAVDRAIEIIRQRVDRYGVTEPSIQKQGTRRVIVELPGIDDPERVRRLLRGTAQLEFRLMAEPNELTRALSGIIEYYEGGGDTGDLGVTPADTALASTDTALMPAPAEDTTADAAADTAFDVGSLLAGDDAVSSGNPLLDALVPLGGGVQFAQVAEPDTATVNRLLANPEVQAMLPPGIRLLYTASPSAVTEDGRELYTLLGVREDVELTGEVITDASVDFDELGQPRVSMTMNADGARIWARVTGANVNKPVAIVLDNVVYSYPNVINRITGGRSSITGLDSQAEAEDVVTVLKSGALPAPVDIVEERTVGPSLGAASIRAGLYSVIVGLMIVALFMIFYYRTAGIVADLALILNILFILGILAGFNATLTLPGIAGIVLTIGMAVDANVLIFERVREESSTGKTLRAAVDAGYAKALSAILDANITTFFVGAILYSFGVGPIQGFAVTLMAGILASMFSAIVFTRIIFDWMIGERRMSVNFG